MLNYVAMCSGHLQGMTYNLLRYEEEAQDASKKNSQMTERLSISEVSYD